jgi:formylglycine-generating enzyme required for sulfatase activity
MDQPDTQQGPAQTSDSNTSGDYLGYGDYADTLWARILAALNKDALAPPAANGEKPLGDDPLVVGIFGEWGAGKSRLLKLIERKAEVLAKERVTARQTNIGQDLTVPVFFQPWKYEHEAHLLLPLLLHILVDLERILKLAYTPTESVAQAVHKTGDAVIAFIPLAIDKLKGLLTGSKAALAASDPTGSTAIALGVVGVLTAILPKLKKSGSAAAIDLSLQGDGRSYYEIHKILKQITRPQKHEHTHPGIKLGQDIRINFVIFIDDLDRCLPEKAVETLELIKTIFNAESFAFVLALDEEVVERGIGHRYKDYTLVGKKPEMPITGFEYLEKIVHLPFRLPALTQAQALGFMAQYESQLIAQRLPHAKQREAWFTDKKISASVAYNEQMESRTTAVLKTIDFGQIGDDTKAAIDSDRRSSKLHLQESDELLLNLAALVTHSFDAYVPRKLIRVIELFHQVLDVLDQRETHKMLQVGGNAKETADPRIVLAHILLQLFQPDLHRTLRRSKTGFDVLLKAFAPTAQGTADKQRQLSERVSDADLLHWAVYGAGGTPPTSLRMAALRVVDKALDEGRRYTSQRLLLLIVERLLEHRAIQRHMFDPLRLFAALQASTQASGVALPDDTRWIYGFLAAKPDTLGWPADDALPVLRRIEPATVTGRATSEQSQPSTSARQAHDWRTPVNVSDIDGLFLTLISPEEPEQRRVAEVAGLQPGQVMTSRNAADLLAACKSRFIKPPAPGAADAGDAERRQRLLRGLQYLAPHISREDGRKFWELVKDVPHGGDLGEPLEDIDQLHARELWADVRSTLGQDPRFDDTRRYGTNPDSSKNSSGVPLHLPKERSKVWETQGLSDKDANAVEPIPGFVRIPGGSFQMGQANAPDNIPRDITIEQPFYIARHLTTVDQYASFVDDGGYLQDGWWDAKGIEWREGLFDSEVGDAEYREYLARRTYDLRNAPLGWEDQRSRGSRPVTCLSWFEARAYARWLQERLSGGGPYMTLFAPKAALAGYKVVLPTEAQWERAARAQDILTCDAQRVWPWQGDDNAAHLKANIEASKIARASVVGLFESNPVGLHDMAGNVWEWQDNLYSRQMRTMQQRCLQDAELTPREDLQQGLFPIRGGSCLDPAANARCARRFRLLPDYWHSANGFRVVLSRANLKSEM